MSSLTIAVLGYNHWEDLTLPCLESIDQAAMPKDVQIEKLLIDNGSRIPYEAREGWTGIRLEKNGGNIQGQNQCFLNMSQTFGWCLFISNDVRVSYYTIRELWSMRGPYQLMPIIYNLDGTVQSWGGSMVWPGYGVNMRYPGRVLDYIPSICYLLPFHLWRDHVFDTQYPMAYEDVDLGKRLGARQLRVCGSASVYHVGNATLGYTNNEPFRKGRRRFIRKHYQGLDKWTRLAVLNLMGSI